MTPSNSLSAVWMHACMCVFVYLPNVCVYVCIHVCAFMIAYGWSGLVIITVCQCVSLHLCLHIVHSCIILGGWQWCIRCVCVSNRRIIYCHFIEVCVCVWYVCEMHHNSLRHEGPSCNGESSLSTQICPVSSHSHTDTHRHTHSGLQPCRQSCISR